MNHNVTSVPMSPYREACDWIIQHPGTDSASSLRKLLLTLGRGGFRLAECLHGLDRARLDLALRVVQHFAFHERDAELIQIERHLEAESPRLLAVLEAAAAAREDLRERWRQEDGSPRS